MNIELFLPFPPTVNNYYVKTKRGVFISQKGRKFREAIKDAVHEQIPGFDVLTCKLLVEVTLFVPDKRIRDLDNYMKALLDSLTQAEVWEDDSQIDQLFIYRGERHYGGSVQISISEAGPVLRLASQLP